MTADRIRAAIPWGSLDAVAIQLVLDYAQVIEANRTQPLLPTENTPPNERPLGFVSVDLT